MAWYQYTYQTTIAEKDTLEDALIAAGAIAVTMQSASDEPIFELEPSDRPMWHDINLTVLTESTLSPEDFSLALANSFGKAINASESEFLPDKDWTREWMDQFHPIPCGERLWIVPSWKDTPNKHAVNLTLDPGLAFGSGTHPTTKMCLEWLDANVNGGETVLDYGCGSGILAIAAVLLGAKIADGTDIDQQAIIASHDNADRNKVSRERFRAYLCEDLAIKHYDIVVANILANPLCGLAETLSSSLASGGQIILSGILVEQSDMVIAAYQPWLELSCINEQDGWVLLAGKKD